MATGASEVSWPAAIGARALDDDEAYQALEAFAARYGRGALLLLMHAAVPETLRADLLQLIRINFLPELNDSSVEADVLFAPLTQALDAGRFRIDPQVRWQALILLRSRYRHEPRSRLVRVAELMWCHLDELARGPAARREALLAEYVEVQRWVALAYLDPAGAAQAFAGALQANVNAVPAARLRLAGVTGAIELPLANQPELLAYAKTLNAVHDGRLDEARRWLGALGDAPLALGRVTLPSVRSWWPSAALGATEGDVYVIGSAETAGSAPQPSRAVESAALPRRAKVFISHSRIDGDVALALDAALQASGVEVLHDLRLKAGDEWEPILRRWLEEADAVVFVVRAGAAQSEKVRSEIDAAVAGVKRIVPVFVGKPDWKRVPAPLADFHGVVVASATRSHPGFERDIRAAADEIVRALDVPLSAPPALPPESGPQTPLDVAIEYDGEVTLQFEWHEHGARRRETLPFDREMTELLRGPSARSAVSGMVASGALGRLQPPGFSAWGVASGRPLRLTLNVDAGAIPWELVFSVPLSEDASPIDLVRVLPPGPGVARSSEALVVASTASEDVVAIGHALEQAGLAVEYGLHPDQREMSDLLASRPWRAVVVYGGTDHSTVRAFDDVFKLKRMPEFLLLDAGTAQLSESVLKAWQSHPLQSRAACMVISTWTIGDAAARAFESTLVKALTRGDTIEAAALSAREAAGRHDPLSATTYQVWSRPGYFLAAPPRSGIKPPTFSATAGTTRALTGTQQKRLGAKAEARRASPTGVALRRGTPPGLKLWTNGSVLRVKLIGAAVAQRQPVERAVKAWSAHANLKFEFVDNGPAEIRIASKPDDGGWSYVGTDALDVAQNEPTVNLGGIDGAPLLGTFGFVLGLIPEHQNPAAKLPWKRAAVYKELTSSPHLWDRQDVANTIFNKYRIQGYRAFDPKSIMMRSFPGHYFTDGVARSGGNRLSASDKELVARLYPPTRR